MPGIPEFLCSVHSKITWIQLPFFAISLRYISERYNTRFPLAFASFNTAVIPFLLIVLIAFVDTFSVIQRFSSGMKKRFFWRLGKKRLFVLLFACETLFPTCGLFPVIWQTRAISALFYYPLRKGIANIGKSLLKFQSGSKIIIGITSKQAGNQPFRVQINEIGNDNIRFRQLFRCMRCGNSNDLAPSSLSGFNAR